VEPEDILRRYFELGWQAIPLEGKRAFIGGWPNLKFTLEELLRYYARGYNVGVKTGWLEGGGLAVVAIDPDEPKLLNFDPDPWLRRGAMAHTTSTGLRIVFYTDSREVAAFSRKVAVKPEDLGEGERGLVEKGRGKGSVTLLEVLAEGRQFMAPPSVHPETGRRLEWVVGPLEPSSCLVVHSLEELRQLLDQSIRRCKWVIEELFETSRLEAGGDGGLLQGWLEEILRKLKPYYAGETPRYYTFHCPFHGPDRHPSFVINKQKFYGYDYHTDEAYSLKGLAERLGLKLKDGHGDATGGAAKPSGDFSIGSYRLGLIGKDVFLYDVSGKPVFSCKLRNLNAESTVKRLAEITNTSRAEVEHVIAAFLLKAASVREARDRGSRQPPPTPQGAEDPAPPWDAEVEARIQAEVQHIVEAENQLEALKPHLDVVVVGEDENKQVGYVLLIGSKYKEPDKKTFIVLKGTEGGGKTHLASNLTGPFKTKEVGRFTEHALEYSDLMHYEVLYIKELGTMDVERQGVAAVKFLSADDRGFVVEYTVKDESGRFRTEQRRIPAMTVISTTTRLVLDRQFERRAWILNVDESEQQTERVKRWKAELGRQRDEVKLGLRKVTDYDFSREVLRRFTAQLKPQKIVIPFREALADVLGSKALRVRGDVDKVYAFIELYALLNLKRLWRLREDVYAVTPEVALEALRLIERPLRRMLSRVDDRVTPLLEALKELGLGEAGAHIDKAARERIAVRLKRAERTVRDLLNSLEEWGYVSGDQRKPKTYTLLYSIEDIEAERAGFSAVSGIADSLKERMVEEARSWLKNGLETGTLGGRAERQHEVEPASTANVEGQPAPRRPPSPTAAPAPAGFQPASERPPARSLNENISENRLFQKLPILQPDSYTMCRECRHYVGPGCELNPGKIIVPTARACEKFEAKEG
jgi:hypothetical protein